MDDPRWQWMDVWEAVPHKGRLAADLGVGLSTAATWFTRGTVPPHVWRRVRQHMTRHAHMTLANEDFLDMAERAHEERAA